MNPPYVPTLVPTVGHMKYRLDGLFQNTFEVRCVVAERLRENLADFNEKLFKNLYQDRLDGPITGHVLVQISRFLKGFSAKSAKFSRNRSKVFLSPSFPPAHIPYA